jgi:lipoate-protein ligase A
MILLHFHNLPIAEQLELEEELLRHDTRNFCIINEGTPPAIVMGISGKAEELIDLSQATDIPILRRFSGGGCVVVDEGTLFVTFICQKNLHPFPAYPEQILRWTGEIYNSAFPEISLRENDYVIGHRKCGGNAQYIRKERWLHHTSFLWNYNPDRMNLLLHPKKTPAYRAGRNHEEFICNLSDYYPDKKEWTTRLKNELQARLDIVSANSVAIAANSPKRCALLSACATTT